MGKTAKMVGPDLLWNYYVTLPPVVFGLLWGILQLERRVAGLEQRPKLPRSLQDVVAAFEGLSSQVRANFCCRVLASAGLVPGDKDKQNRPHPPPPEHGGSKSENPRT